MLSTDAEELVAADVVVGFASETASAAFQAAVVVV